MLKKAINTMAATHMLPIILLVLLRLLLKDASPSFLGRH
jgi:hypothetical protein